MSNTRVQGLALVAGAASCLAAFLCSWHPRAAWAQSTETQGAKRQTQPERAITSETAHMLPAGQLLIGAALSHTGAPQAELRVGLGRLAQLSFERRPEWEDNAPLKMATFKTGIPQGLLFSHSPALAVVFRKNFYRDDTSSEDADTDPAQRRLARLAVVASLAVRSVDLTIGGEYIEADGIDEAANDSSDLRVVRPTAALSWQPRDYPRTTLLADLRWIPGGDSAETASALWNASWGARYQALDWARVELNVRHEENQGASDALVTLGVAGILDLASVF